MRDPGRSLLGALAVVSKIKKSCVRSFRRPAAHTAFSTTTTLTFSFKRGLRPCCTLLAKLSKKSPVFKNSSKAKRWQRKKCEFSLLPSIPSPILPSAGLVCSPPRLPHLPARPKTPPLSVNYADTALATSTSSSSVPARLASVLQSVSTRSYAYEPARAPLTAS